MRACETFSVKLPFLDCAEKGLYNKCWGNQVEPTKKK